MRVTDCLLVLLRPYEGAPRPPRAYPFGRAALELADDGLYVVFGHEIEDGRASGWTVNGDSWRRVDGVPVRAVHDRLAGAPWASLRRSLLAELPPHVPVANPESVRAVCRDKLASHRFLEAAGVPLPEVAEGADAPRRLRRWGAAYSKPREGSRGDGVRRVQPGDSLEGGDFLQQAIDPAPGSPRVALRLLAQRNPDRTWRLNPAVARIAHGPTDVVCVHTGARAAPAHEVCEPDRLAALAAAVAASFDDPWALELGLDFVLDANRRPWLIEVNSVPRGRLGALAQLDPSAFERAHIDACARPLRTLAAWTEDGVRPPPVDRTRSGSGLVPGRPSGSLGTRPDPD
jgi:hypothetical protein